MRMEEGIGPNISSESGELVGSFTLTLIMRSNGGEEEKWRAAMSL